MGTVASGSTYAFLTVPVLGAIFFLIQAFYIRTSRQLRLLDLEAKTPLYTKISESSAGIEHIRTLGWETTAVKESFELLDYAQIPFYYMYSIQRWLQLVLDLTCTVFTVVMVTIALNWPKTTSQPSLGLALLGSIYLSGIAQRAILDWTNLETSLGCIMRLKTFINDTPKEEDDEDAKEGPNNWPSAGLVTFQHVGATYRCVFCLSGVLISKHANSIDVVRMASLSWL